MTIKQFIKLKLATQLEKHGFKFGEVRVTDPEGNSTVLYYDGDANSPSVGDDVFVEDSEGNRIPAPDGNYLTEDRVLLVEGGSVLEADDKTEGDMSKKEASKMETTDIDIEVVVSAIAEVLPDIIEESISEIKEEVESMKSEFKMMKEKAIPEQKQEGKAVKDNSGYDLSKFGLK